MKPSDSLFCGKQQITKTHKERGHVQKNDAGSRQN